MLRTGSFIMVHSAAAEEGEEVPPLQIIHLRRGHFLFYSKTGVAHRRPPSAGSTRPKTWSNPLCRSSLPENRGLPDSLYRSSLPERRGILAAKARKKGQPCGCPWCWHYLSSRSVSRQVFSAEASLTSVFGMGTGGPSL